MYSNLGMFLVWILVLKTFFFSEVECSQGAYLFSEAVVFFFFLNPGFFFPKVRR